MNLRTLKKLSKRAAPLLSLLGDHREQFPAAKDENYHRLSITARKHYERGRSVHGNPSGIGETKKPAADGRGWVYMRPPVHPRKGTVMVGSVSGYEEPEWEEMTAWDSLREIVSWHFVEFDDSGEIIGSTSFRHPRDVFVAAGQMITAGGMK